MSLVRFCTSDFYLMLSVTFSWCVSIEDRNQGHAEPSHMSQFPCVISLLTSLNCKPDTCIFHAYPLSNMPVRTCINPGSLMQKMVEALSATFALPLGLSFLLVSCSACSELWFWQFTAKMWSLLKLYPCAFHPIHRNELYDWKLGDKNSELESNSCFPWRADTSFTVRAWTRISSTLRLLFSRSWSKE